VDDLLNKQNLGPLNVVAVEPDGTTVKATLGTLAYPQYDRSAYDRGSGIVTLKLSAEAASIAASSDIQIRSGEDEIYLAETDLRPLPVEHNRYVDETDPATPFKVQVYYRGLPALGGVNVTMYDGNTMAPLATKTTDQGGSVEFDIAPTAGGGCQPYVFGAGSAPAPAQLDPQLTPYAYVRTLPSDSAIAAMDPSWANVYNYVLANWNAMAPCMDNWLRLDDPDQVRAYAPVLKQLTDPAYFEHYRYMPVTRDLTAGERTLLYAFLDPPRKVESASDDLAPESAPPEEKPALRDVAAMSRAFRSR
jgi:hypothetical protein